MANQTVGILGESQTLSAIFVYLIRLQHCKVLLQSTRLLYTDCRRPSDLMLF